MQRTKRRGRKGRWLGALFQSPLERERAFYRRLRDLGDCIQEAPDSFTHYVLRGELYLGRGEYERAKADFEMALQLTETSDQKSGWQIVEQVMRDRALYGKEQVESKLPASGSGRQTAILEA